MKNKWLEQSATVRHSAVNPPSLRLIHSSLTQTAFAIHFPSATTFYITTTRERVFISAPHHSHRVRNLQLTSKKIARTFLKAWILVPIRYYRDEFKWISRTVSDVWLTIEARRVTCYKLHVYTNPHRLRAVRWITAVSSICNVLKEHVYRALSDWAT